MSAQPTIPLNNKRIVRAWILFDWANSAFALVITVAIFPAYYTRVTFDSIHLWGLDFSNSALYAFVISLAYFVLAIVSPLLSGIADYGGKKKFFLKLFTYIGSTGCITLFFFTGMDETASNAYNIGQLAIGTISFMLGLIGFAGALVFYNSYLPEIVTEERYDVVSARGYSMGYIGSVSLLIVNLIIILNPGWFGITDDIFAIRLAFLMVGLWWLGWSLIPFRVLPNDEKPDHQENLLRKGADELRKVWRFVKGQVNIKYFLVSFLCYSAGVQTLLFMAATFAEVELQFETDELITIILILQAVGVAGAYLFAKVSDWYGNKLSLMVQLVIWIAICFFAYTVTGKGQFYGIAGAVGLVMGGIQSLSRSTYSKLIPENTEDTTSFFSFYDVLEKVSVIGGTLIFGVLTQLTGDMRVSILVLGGLFVVGMLILVRVKVQPAEGQVAPL